MLTAENRRHPALFAMDETAARQITTWQYKPPYDVYSIPADEAEATIRFFNDPANGYWKILNSEEELVGFSCFGADGRVPGGDYSLEALDIGMGVKPDLTGQGLGDLFTETVISFAIQTYQPDALRVTIATFNRRAQRVWEKAGFKFFDSFHSLHGGKEFEIFIKHLT